MYMKELSFSPKQIEAVRHIRNSLVHKGRLPSVRELMKALGYKSPRSASLIIDELISKGILKKRPDGDLQLVKDPESHSRHAQTIDVPLVGSVACGMPLLAQENIEGFVSVSKMLAHAGSKYFLLRASGDSMNKARINDGDLVLIRQQSSAEEGEKVVALIDGEATVKELHFGQGAIALLPKSTNKKHKPIILTEDFQIQGVVVAVIPKIKMEG